MLSLSLAPNTPLFYLFIFFCSVTFLLLSYYLVLFIRLAFYKEKQHQKRPEGVSVVICAKNGFHNLKENLPSILEQDYPNFEVVVVNYNSDDDSIYLLNNLSEEDPRLKVVEIKENLNFFSGKKFPLSIGIKSAQNDIILVTEPHCKPASRNWITLMSMQFSAKTEVVVGFGGFVKEKGFLNKLIRYDIALNALKYLSFAISGVPYMGVGRNLAFRRSLFFKNQGLISHYKVKAGEDDLFVNKVAKKSNTRVMITPQGFTTSFSKIDFRNWFLLKKRQITTPYYYRLGHKLLLTLFHVCTLLFYGLFILLLLFQYNPLLLLSIFLFRLIIQWLVYFNGMKRIKSKELAWLTPLFELLLMTLHGAAFISHLFTKKKRWK